MRKHADVANISQFAARDWCLGDSVGFVNWLIGANLNGTGFEAIGHNGGTAMFGHQVHVERTGLEAIATRQVSDVPEPATLALLVLGLAGMGFSRKRQRRDAASV